MATEVTLKVQLKAQRELFGYITYIFKLTNPEDMKALGMLTPLLKATRFPNWQERNLEIGEISYVSFNLVQAGETYYNASEDKTYKWKNSYVQFLKVVDIDDTEPELVIMN